jgi:hypothetical protein
MPSAARSIPDQSAILCETCGYILDGLPHHSNCPECGKPLSESARENRTLPLWERDEPTLSTTQKFLSTSGEVLFHPTRFYRSLATRPDADHSWRFARIHLWLCSALFGWAAYLQAIIITNWSSRSWTRFIANDDDMVTLLDLFKMIFWPIISALLAFYALVAISRLAARLTAWEAGYRGLRLPLSVVHRGLNFHAVHYLPVAMIAALTVTSYVFLIGSGTISELHGPLYLYILCAEVILAAGYLFITYWTGMRNMLYANA